jgi:integrase
MIKPKLTDTLLRSSKMIGKVYANDGTGLFVSFRESGSKLFHMTCTVNGKRKLLSLGIYPEVTLAMAKQRAIASRRLCSEGIDPKIYKDQKKAKTSADDSFEYVALEFLTKKLRPTKRTAHVDRVESRLKRFVYPYIGKSKLSDIKAPEILTILRRIEGFGIVESAHRTYQVIGQIFRFGIATGRITLDPTPSLRGSLTPYKSKVFPAPLEPMRIGEILIAIDGYSGSSSVKTALKLGALVFVRPGELRQAEWKDIDLETREWRFVVSKTDKEHIVPLSIQAIKILNDIKPLTSHCKYVFPSARSPKGDRPMSDNAVLVALRTLGIVADEMVGHSWRAIARTLLDEVLKFDEKIIEHQLAHRVKDHNGTSYNRTKFLSERHEMMQTWSNYLDKLRCDAAPKPRASNVPLIIGLES